MKHPMFICYATLAFILTGCGEAKQAFDFARTQNIGTQEQSDAENLCLQKAFEAETKNTKGLVKLLDQNVDTLVQSRGDFLITVSYKKVTVDDKDAVSNNLDMYGTANCEVKDGKLLSGQIMKNGMSD